MVTRLSQWIKQGWLWVLIGSLCLWLWLSWLNRPVSHVVITHSAPNISLAECHLLMDPILHQGWGGLSLHKLKQTLLLGDWVGEVVLERVWPYQLNVALYEREAIAQFDQHTFIDPSGKIFHASNPLQTKNRLIQYLGQESEVAELYAFHKFLMTYGGMVNELQGMQYLKGISWHLFFDHGVQVVLSDHEARYQWQRFSAMYEKLSMRLPLQGKVIDLRDPDGVAIH